MVKIKSKNILVLVVEIEGNDTEAIKENLEDIFNKKFFTSNSGMPFLIQPKGEVKEEVIQEVTAFLTQKGLKPLMQSPKGERKSTPARVDLEEVKSSSVLVVNRNLRSGQVVEHAGDILIIGDVNPGAEVKATGNIIVMGALKGVAWAGYLGNTDAVIVALKMEPQQLRIANVFAAPESEEEKYSPGHPEVAKIEGDEIVIEPLV